MSSFKLQSAVTEALTQERAKEFSTMPASPTERPLDKNRVKFLREQIEGGLAVTFHWSTAEVNGKTVRMNGQHSSAALCELTTPFPEGLIVHLDHYKVEGQDGEALLFRQFDSRKSGRGPADVSGAYQCLYPDIADVPRLAAKQSIEGVSWYRREVEGMPKEKAPSGDDVYSLFNEKPLHSFINWVGDVIGIKQPEMRRLQVASAMYGTFMANETVAREFWNAVARGGVEYEDDAPASVLSSWLLAAKRKELKAPPKPAHFYQASIYAWNAHREGKALKNITVSTFDKLKGLLEPIS